MLTTLQLLRALAGASEVLPTGFTRRLAEGIGRVDGRLRSDRYGQFASNLAAVSPGTDVSSGVGSYGRYWAESLACPTVGDIELDRGFSFVGYDHILGVQATGRGPIICLPHLGGWEWAAAWLARIANNPVTAVAENLGGETFDWFCAQREAYGIEVVAHDDPAATTTLLERIEEGRILTLVADRDLAGDGVEVELFGRTTTVPGGPALLSLRTGSPILPTAVYFRRRDRLCRVGAPMYPVRQGRLRDDVQRVSQAMVARFEALIAAAPEQWHVLGPLWLADRTFGDGSDS